MLLLAGFESPLVPGERTSSSGRREAVWVHSVLCKPWVATLDFASQRKLFKAMRNRVWDKILSSDHSVFGANEVVWELPLWGAQLQVRAAAAAI